MRLECRDNRHCAGCVKTIHCNDCGGALRARFVTVPHRECTERNWIDSFPICPHCQKPLLGWWVSE